jgi:hypothetical protein
MPKGRHRRHREARNLKTQAIEDTLTTTDELCEECGRDPHAEWCMADAPDEDFE